jgi:hypothetical protein
VLITPPILYRILFYMHIQYSRMYIYISCLCKCYMYTFVCAYVYSIWVCCMPVCIYVCV